LCEALINKSAMSEPHHRLQLKALQAQPDGSEVLMYQCVECAENWQRVKPGRGKGRSDRRWRRF
jgi:hypothetical protein